MNTLSNIHQPLPSSLLAHWWQAARSKSLHARYSQYRQLTSHLHSFALLFLRLTIAWQLAESGYGHLTNVQATVQHFRQWGVPFPQINVYISGATELVGGTLLMLGLGARVISLPLLFNFFVAYATASRDSVIQLLAGPRRLEAYDAVINDAAFTMIVLSLAMLAFGAGKFSVDYLVKRMLQKRAAQANELSDSGSSATM